MATFLVKWLQRCQGSSAWPFTSVEYRVHLRSKKVDALSALYTHPRRSSSSFTQGYHPLMQKTLVPCATPLRRFQSSKSRKAPSPAAASAAVLLSVSLSKMRRAPSASTLGLRSSCSCLSCSARLCASPSARRFSSRSALDSCASRRMRSFTSCARLACRCCSEVACSLERSCSSLSDARCSCALLHATRAARRRRPFSSSLIGGAGGGAAASLPAERRRARRSAAALPAAPPLSAAPCSGLRLPELRRSDVRCSCRSVFSLTFRRRAAFCSSARRSRSSRCAFSCFIRSRYTLYFCLWRWRAARILSTRSASAASAARRCSSSSSCVLASLCAFAGAASWAPAQPRRSRARAHSSSVSERWRCCLRCSAERAWALWRAFLRARASRYLRWRSCASNVPRRAPLGGGASDWGAGGVASAAGASEALPGVSALPLRLRPESSASSASSISS